MCWRERETERVLQGVGFPLLTFAAHQFYSSPDLSLSPLISSPTSMVARWLRCFPQDEQFSHSPYQFWTTEAHIWGNQIWVLAIESDQFDDRFLSFSAKVACDCVCSRSNDLAAGTSLPRQISMDSPPIPTTRSIGSTRSQFFFFFFVLLFFQWLMPLFVRKKMAEKEPMKPGGFL